MALTAEQLATRQQGIGGSDAAAAVNLSRWKSPLRLWQEKVGEAKPEPADNEYQHFGRVLEGVVADEFARRRGLKLRRVNQTLRHAEFDFMMAHIDRRVLGAREGLECKTASLRMAKDWGEESDAVPTEYLAQAAHYMGVTGFDAWHVAVLIAGNSFKMYRIERDQELIEALFVRERIFWHCVVTRTPPDPVNLEDASILWPHDTGGWLTAPIDIANECVQLASIKGSIKELEAAAAERQLKVEAFMKTNTTLLADATHQLATWRTQEATRVDIGKLRREFPDIAKQCEYVQQSRVFRLK
jgi:putative phage-type endonuclease